MKAGLTSIPFAKQRFAGSIYEVDLNTACDGKLSGITNILQANRVIPDWTWRQADAAIAQDRASGRFDGEDVFFTLNGKKAVFLTGGYCKGLSDLSSGADWQDKFIAHINKLTASEPVHQLDTKA